MNAPSTAPRSAIVEEQRAADQALKAKHRAMWAFGDYDAVSVEVISDLGPTIVDALQIAADDRVLDIAAGSGNASIPAASRGATVVASDLTPELLETGRQRAERMGISLEWQEADAENLPYDDASFDVVMSTVGVMFAPHHQIAADELLRVTRSGGRIGLINWTPEGFIGQLFATMKPFAAPPAPGSSPAPLWGSEEHVRELFGDRATGLTAQRRQLSVPVFATGAAFRDYFRSNYGPTIAAYRGLADDPTRTQELDAALEELGDRYATGTEEGAVGMQWEYLLVTATRV
ncbi:class I SAM-dependent methyltransferase [soil metagenome]